MIEQAGAFGRYASASEIRVISVMNHCVLEIEASAAVLLKMIYHSAMLETLLSCFQAVDLWSQCHSNTRQLDALHVVKKIANVLLYVLGSYLETQLIHYGNCAPV
jgi:hypothetical protein